MSGNTPDILERILEVKAVEVSRARAARSLESLRAEAEATRSL